MIVNATFTANTSPQDAKKAVCRMTHTVARWSIRDSPSSSKEGREGPALRQGRRSRCSRNDPRTGRRRHRRAREHGAAREHRPKIDAMRVDFVRWSRHAVLRARLAEFAYHRKIATMTVPAHSSALKLVRRNETTVASPCDFRRICTGFTDAPSSRPAGGFSTCSRRGGRVAGHRIGVRVPRSSERRRVRGGLRRCDFANLLVRSR